jgi:hypothetical protein
METVRSTTNLQKEVSTVRLGKTLLGGVIAGLIAAIVSVLAANVLSHITGYSFKELTLTSITVASIMTNLIGSLIFYYLTKKSRGAVLIYTILAILMATLDSLLAALNPPGKGFGTLAIPIHYIVAIISILIVPKFSQRR